MNYGKHSTKRLEKQADAKSTKIRKKFGIIICKAVLIGILLVVVIGGCAGVGIMKGIIDSAPDISEIDVTPTGFSTTVLASDGTETATLVGSGSNRQYVTIDEIPEYLQHAFVAVEDSRFYEHNGIDLYGIGRAAVSGILSGGDFDQGASTITQQLIKNNVLTTWTSETTFIERLQRKIQEQYLAVKLEEQVQDKDWILENYLNSINLGANTLGVQAASQKYFGKDVSELTLSECAVIAGITKNPSGYNPITHPDANAKRRTKVLDDMLDQKYITQSEYNEAMADDVYSRIAEYNSVNDDSVNSYFVDALIEQVIDDLVNIKGYSETEAYKAIYQGGLTINSTQDLNIQQIADEEVNNADNYSGNPKYSFSLSFQVKLADGTYKTYTNQTMLSYYKEKTGNQEFSIDYSSEDECYAAISQYEQDVLGEGDTIVDGTESIHITLQPQVAATIMDQYSGKVLALVGGRGDKVGNRTWNRATDTTRQPGSCFKIIGCYAPALDAGGRTLASVEDDAPFTVGSKTFNNYDFRYRGFTNYRTAITNSMNVVTVKALQRIGVDLGYQYAQSFGFTTLVDQDKNLALALGGLTNGVTNLELTAAYATIANSGDYNEPIFYTTIYDHDGNLLLDRTENQEQHEVLSDDTAWLLTDAMKDVLTSGTGKSAYFGMNMGQAGKTGTTTGNRDTVFAAYTPYYTCAIWGGYDDNAMENGSTNYPKVIWKSIMTRLHEGLEPKDFTMPSTISTASVCKESGLLPLEGVCDNDQRGSTVYTEYFAKDTVPTTQCDHHTLLNIDNSTGLIANAFCPADLVEQKVFIIGGTPGTEENDFQASEDFLNRTCDVHNASNTGTTTTDPVQTDPASTNSGTGSDSTSTSTTTSNSTSTTSTGTSGDNGSTGTSSDQSGNKNNPSDNGN